jgi:excisionase family DNA binding protein
VQDDACGGGELGRTMSTRTAPEALPTLLTIFEVAALLRTSRKAIYAMAERGQLPGAIHIGRRLLVRRDDLLSWLDERRAASPGGTRR